MGVRGRLLLAFFAVSVFAILGAAVSFYSFRKFGNALALITQQRTPAALKSQELARQVERIVAAAPALLTAPSRAEKDKRAAEISSDEGVLYKLLAELTEAGVESAVIQGLETDVKRLNENLTKFDALVINRLLVGDRKKNLLSDAIQAAAILQELLAPWSAVMDQAISQWRRSKLDPTLPSARRSKIDAEFEKSLGWFRALQTSQVAASNASDMLQRAASADTESDVKVARFRLQQALNELERLTGDFDVRLRSLMVDAIAKLRPFAIGHDSIPDLRLREIDSIVHGRKLLSENAELSKSLTSTVDDLVRKARADIIGANNDALFVVQFSSWIFVIAVVLSLVSSILIVWFLARKIVVPIQTLGAGAVRVGAGDLTQRLSIKTGDELEALANQFNDMADRLQESYAGLEKKVEQRTSQLSNSLADLRTAQNRLVQTEKLASLGQLTAGIAHEIKNPLNFVNNFSSVSVELIDDLQDALKGAQIDASTRADIATVAAMLRGNLDKIVQHGRRADSIVKNMLLHSRTGSGEHRPVDINGIVEESLNLAYHGARAEKRGFNITLEKSFDPAAGEIDLFPQEITRVFLNLISNGFYATTKRKTDGDSGGAYEPTLLAATKDLGDRVEIRIRDNGTGIPPDVRDKMFNPFFTTKPVGEGTGLGLSISHDIIVKQHAGTIEIDTKTGEYTEFRIILPRKAASPVTSGA
jgi:signal transduction histidine kinase